ncbi:MAG: TIGR03118 family protein [Isosphaeraceae bacterium]
MHKILRRFASITCALVIAAGTARAGDVYVQTNLVSNGTVPNTVTDSNLIGAWGLSFSTTSPIWISDQAANVNGSGASTVYKVSDTQPPSSSGALLTVGVANQGNAPPNPNQNNGPTGQVNTSAPGISTTAGTDFVLGNGKSASFIFANLDGSISGWNGGTLSTITASVGGASFTGLAIGNSSAGPELYAADQNSGNIDVFNNKFQAVGTLVDPNYTSTLKPLGINAFNVQNLSVNGVQTLFVTYANQATGGSVVDEFSTNGVYLKTLIDDTAGAHLNAAWGLAIAPAGWGKFGGDLLVGNNNADANGNTTINAYSLTTGAFEGTLTLNTGQPFSETELWALSFGNNAGAGSSNTLFFTAGLDGNTNGLLGSISVQSVPEPSSAVLALIAAGVLVGGWRWKNRRHVATT